MSLSATMPELPIEAAVWSDDRRCEVSFDARDYFAQAAEADILKLHAIGWRGDQPADDVALFFDGKHFEITNLLDYVRSGTLPEDFSSFECSVDRDSAMAWLQAYRNGLYWKIREQEGTDVKVTAVVEETLTITKNVSLYVDSSHTDESEVADAVREKAYEELAIDPESGWEATCGSGEGEMRITMGDETFTESI